MKKLIEIECASCGGTGIYSGMAESEEIAVVCHTCKGTGKDTFEYKEFTGRKRRNKIKRILMCNPGIKVGGPNPEQFGGMPYSDWLADLPFPAKSEMRLFTCPAWWYQNADYNRKPEWKECYSMLGASFSKCKSFPTKTKCWERWEKEFGNKPQKYK